MVPLGTANRLAFFSCPECQSRYCSSENSCAPPPVPRITPICRFSSIDMAVRSSPRILNRFVCCGNRKRHYARNVLALARIHPGEFIKLRNFAGNVNRQGRRIEAGNAFDSRFTRKNGPAKRFFADAVGTDNTHSSDHYTREHVGFRCLRERYVTPKWDNRTECRSVCTYRSRFCRTKCTFCNFASDVFSRAAFQRYVDRVCSDIEHAAETAEQMGGQFEGAVDTIYLGGGTPTTLDISHLERLFVTISQNFEIAARGGNHGRVRPGNSNPRRY